MSVSKRIPEYKIIARSKYFNKRWYLKQYPDVASARIDPVEHYLHYGWKEGKDPSSKFDTKYYLKCNEDVRIGGINPLVHYEIFGKKEKREILPVNKRLGLLSKTILFFKNLKYRKYSVRNHKLYIGNTLTYQPNFSIIMPTYNRKDLIIKAIYSVVNQTYQNFELIIVDDGSTDGTEKTVYNKYAKEIKKGKIKYIKQQNGGVCKARNTGLLNSRNDWIAYLDSDNEMLPNFLEIFAINILEHSHKKLFYAKLLKKPHEHVLGKKFTMKSILKKNFIDLGTFVNNRKVYEQLGGFDENMTRLVDWELIVRYVKKFSPYFVDKIVLFYNDSNNFDRITNTISYETNLNYFKHKHYKTVINK